jgi:hypothetical protein
MGNQIADPVGNRAGSLAISKPLLEDLGILGL